MVMWIVDPEDQSSGKKQIKKNVKIQKLLKKIGQ